jgi:hypothetical protein
MKDFLTGAIQTFLALTPIWGFGLYLWWFY